MLLTATAKDGVIKLGTRAAQLQKNAYKNINKKYLSRKAPSSKKRLLALLSISFGLIIEIAIPRVTRTIKPIARVAQPKEPEAVRVARKTAE